MTGMFRKIGLGAAVAATALVAAAPASAQRYGYGYHHHHHGGDVAAGAILGGILGLGVGAAIASNDRGTYYDRGYYAPPPPPPPPVYRGYESGYYEGPGYYRDDAPRCFSQWRFDPYYGRNVRVQVCR